VIDLRCKRFLIRRKRGRQGGKTDEDDKRESDGAFPLVRITHNLKQSGALAAFGGNASSPVGRQRYPSWYLQIDHHVSARSFVSLFLFYNGHGRTLIAVAHRPTHFYFASIF
jgi:hypothetical protein